MTALDILLLLPLGIGAVKGYRRGLVLEMVSLLAFVLGVVGGLSLLSAAVPLVRQYVGDAFGMLPLVAFALVFVAIMWGVHLLGGLLKTAVHLTPLGVLDNLLGGAAAAGITPEAEQKLLNKAAKQRRDAAAIYKEQFRSELEENELAELVIIEEYLPQQLSEADLVERLVHIIQRVGATGPSDLGKVMGVAARELSGQADGKRISDVLGHLLNNTNL